MKSVDVLIQDEKIAKWFVDNYCVRKFFLKSVKRGQKTTTKVISIPIKEGQAFRTLIDKVIYLEKASSLISAVVFKDIIEEKYVYEFSSKVFQVIRLELTPHDGYRLFLTGNSKAIDRLCKLLRIPEVPFLAKSRKFSLKIESQNMHRLQEQFFADRYLNASDVLKYIWNVIHYGFHSAAMIMSINAEISWFCNRRCSYCPVSKLKRVVQERMDINTFEKVVKEMGCYNYSGYFHYNFYNETLLDNRLEQFIRLARNYCPNAKNHINTNGDLLTLEKYKQLISAGTDFVFVTLHDGFMTSKMRTLLIDAKQHDNSIDYEFPNNMVFNNRGGLVEVGNNAGKIKPCYLPSYDVEITANGTVLPCCNDYTEKMKMGNVLSNPLKSIWISKKFRHFRADLRRGYRYKYDLCKDCNY